MRGPADAGEGGEYNPQHYGPVPTHGGGYVPRPAGEDGTEPLFPIVDPLSIFFFFYIFHFPFSEISIHSKSLVLFDP